MQNGGQCMIWEESLVYYVLQRLGLLQLVAYWLLTYCLLQYAPIVVQEKFASSFAGVELVLYGSIIRAGVNIGSAHKLTLATRTIRNVSAVYIRHALLARPIDLHHTGLKLICSSEP
eukprot:scaffold69407_cov26-Prasinocladus_malaysianus.AAC.1